MFFLLCMFLAAFPAAAEPGWDGSTAAPTAASSENENYDYEIGTAAQFAGFRNWINDTDAGEDTPPENVRSKKYILTDNIDLGGKDWIPIGFNEDDPFNGVFHGGGHSVSNFKIVGSDYPSYSYSYSSGYDSPPAYAGLFGVLAGDVVSLDVTSFDINVNCKDEIAFAYVGGLAGLQLGGSIADSCATGSVYVSSAANLVCAGGLVGIQTDGEIRKSYATGSVSAATYGSFGDYDGLGVATGGLVGWQYGGGSVETSYAVNSVFAHSHGSVQALAGGLVGSQYIKGNVKTSYAAGSVFACSPNSSARAGGLVGAQQVDIDGGADIKVEASYAAGSVFASSPNDSARAGGLVGYANGAENSSGSVFDKQGTAQVRGIGNTDAAGVTAKKNADMITSTSPVEFGDTENEIWQSEESRYPQLQAMASLFPKPSAFSVIAIHYTGKDTSRNITQRFSVPETLDSDKLNWTWKPNALDWEAGSASQAQTQAADRLWLVPTEYSKNVLLTVSFDNDGTVLTRTFALATVEPSEPEEPEQPELPVEIPSIPSEEPDTDPPETEIYDIRLSVTDVYPFVHFFPDAPAGYGIATPLEVAVNNAGNRPTGILSVWLLGPDKDCFLVSAESVGEEGEDFFTVRPKENLEARTEPYTATVTVSGDHGIEKSFGVSFTVTPAPAIVPVPGQLSFSLAMALGETQIFEALVSPDSAVEWSVTHNPSPDVFPIPGVHVVEIVSDDAAGGRSASGRAAAYTQEPVAARRVRVTATALGTAEITVKTPDGEIFAKCLVAVNPAKEPPEPVIVERGGGGCRGAGASGLVTGLAIFALALAARRAEARRP